jgi:hypothetical protein
LCPRQHNAVFCCRRAPQARSEATRAASPSGQQQKLSSDAFSHCASIQYASFSVADDADSHRDVGK